MADYQDIQQEVDGYTRRIYALGEIARPRHSCYANLSPTDAQALSNTELVDFNSLVTDLNAGLRIIRASIAAHRNRFIPVNRLPPEILGVIFWVHANSHTRWHINSALSISHTCTHWRAVSLNYPAMWNEIGLSQTSLPIARLFFERAAPHPIKIRHCDSEVKSNVLALLLDNLGSVKDLSLDVMGADFSYDLVCGKVPFDGSLLDRVSLRSPSTRSHSALYILPKSLFGEYAPHLRHIELDRIRMPWNSGFYKGLSTLKISNCPTGVRSNRDMDICLVLRDCPNLEVLHLSLFCDTPWNSEADILVESHAGRPPLTLSSLHTVNLETPVQYAHYLLSHIGAESLQTLTVSFGHVSKYNTHLLNLFAPGLVPSRLMSRLDSLRVHGNKFPNCTIGIFGQTSDGSASVSLQWSDPGHCGYTARYDILQQIADSIQAYHNIPLLKEVELRLDTELPRTTFWSTLIQYKTLTSLRLVGVGAALTIVRGMPGEDIESSEANDWPRITHLCVLATFDLDEALSLVGWCRGRRSLRSLDLSGSVIEAESKERLVDFIRAAHQLVVAVKWDNCSFKVPRLPVYKDVKDVLRSDDISGNLFDVFEDVAPDS